MLETYGISMHRSLPGRPWIWEVRCDGEVIAEGEAFSTDTAKAAAANALCRTTASKPKEES
jgi:dsRNA-specific ribonuclease